MAANEQLPVFLVLAVLLLVPAPAAGAFNITKILADFPEFDVLNALLLDTGLAHAINTREAVTLLAPNNTAFVALARGAPRGTTRSFITDLLALHVVLDYLDAPKLAAMQRGRRGDGSVLTTLLQSTRNVPRGAGFLRVVSLASNASASGGDRVTFSSAAPGGQRNATFERQVVAQPYNVSVLKVSGFVVPPGIKFVQPFPPPRARRHVAAPPPGQAPGPAPAPGPMHPPVSGSGPLIPSPVRPFPTPDLTDSPPPLPEEETGVIPIPSVHGGMAAKLPPSAAAVGHKAANWWSGLAVVLLLGSL
ncbi:hypothetical protein PR202_gb06388 [Eleusine coracana subsp. coracana]|uniref:FAS1 domain-containing protein n=1 Tax=Eleusine coracana subsp. coracana TaxID=191504 RepID=A0AAV5E9H1_ELECO|nr:hypothetical protein QOZ80_2BG0156800 [Eleusine coracana subsp. coracana]GJN19146.1 hypothetical protein PR202_gb06388 [Eleusine coracana subsp. coracana]